MKHKCYKRILSKTCSFPCLKVVEMWQVYASPKNKKVNNKDYLLYNNRNSLQISHCWFLSVKFTSSESSSLCDWKCTCHRHTHPFWENRVQQLPLLYPLRTEIFLQSAPRKQGGKSKLQRKVGLRKVTSLQVLVLERLLQVSDWQLLFKEWKMGDVSNTRNCTS